MDQRRASEDTPRHDHVEGAPIVSEHQIEAAGVAGEAKEAPGRRHAGERRPVLREIRFDADLQRIPGGERPRDCAQHRVLGGKAEGVHQPHRARFLAAKCEGRMDMEDARRHRGLIAQDKREGKNGGHTAIIEQGCEMLAQICLGSETCVMF
jgi:hypothetical protein